MAAKRVNSRANGVQTMCDQILKTQFTKMHKIICKHQRPSGYGEAILFSTSPPTLFDAISRSKMEGGPASQPASSFI